MPATMTSTTMVPQLLYLALQPAAADQDMSERNHGGAARIRIVSPPLWREFIQSMSAGCSFSQPEEALDQVLSLIRSPRHRNLTNIVTLRENGGLVRHGHLAPSVKDSLLVLDFQLGVDVDADFPCQHAHFDEVVSILGPKARTASRLVLILGLLIDTDKVDRVHHRREESHAVSELVCLKDILKQTTQLLIAHGAHQLERVEHSQALDCCFHKREDGMLCFATP